MTQLPDLPSLEAVEIRLRERPVLATIALVIVSGVMGLFAWAYIRGCDCDPDLLWAAIPATVIGGGLWLWILYRLLSADFHWRTSAEGLWSRNPLRQRLVRWEDMGSVPRIAGKRPSSDKPIVLDASIWQHLRRLGKATDEDVSEFARTFWDEIPDDLPRVMEWDNPAPVRKWHRFLRLGSAVLVALGLVLLIVCLATDSWRALLDWVWICWSAAVLSGEFLLIYGLCLQPERVTLDGEALRARTVRGNAEIRPGEVTAAWWDGTGMLHLRTAKVHTEVPLNSIHDESSRLILAIIRWLRTAPRPVLVVIPPVLRAPFDDDVLRASESPGAPGDRAEIRVSRQDKLAIIVLVAMFAISIPLALLAKSPTRVQALAVSASLVVVSLLTWLIAGSFAMVADRTALTKSFLLWKKRVEWHDVASYTVGNKAGSGVQNVSMRHTLWSAAGRPLMPLSPQCGSRAAWEAFIGFVFARLSEVIPQDRLVKSWKARPWSAPRTPD